MKEINSSVFGQVSSPETFEELLLLISQNKVEKNSRNVSFWRGQSNLDWRIDSAAVRRLKLSREITNYPKEIDENHLSYYEENLLGRARTNMFDFDNHNRRMTDFELLSKLQHHGAATRLVDFSKSALIGLFFCTTEKRHENDYGLLFGINTDVLGGSEDHFEYDFSYKEYQDFIKEHNHVLCISPPPLNNRMAAQHAVLLCSKFDDGNYGSLFLNDNSKFYKYIAISPELKIECNYYLTKCFNITRVTMFPDFTGFCEINSANWEIYAHTRW